MRYVESRSVFGGLIACLRGQAPRAVDWIEIVSLANKHLVSPALHSVIDGNPVFKDCPNDVQSYLRQLYALNRERNARLKGQLIEAVRNLNDVGVEPYVIKGAASLITEPPDRSGLRMMADIDLIVSPAQLAQSLSILFSLGYRVRNESVGAHACASLGRPQDVGTIDLHHRLPGPVALCGPGAPLCGEQVDVGGGRAQVLSPTDQLAQIVIHDMLHDRRLRRGSLDLRHLLDLRTLIVSKGNRIDWEILRVRFHSGTAAWALSVCLLNLRELLEVPVPIGATDGLIPRLLHRRQMLKLSAPLFERVDNFAIPYARRAWAFLKLADSHRWA